MNNGFYEFSRGKHQTTSSVFPFTGSAQITGSLGVTGIISATQGFTGSLFGTSSWAVSASWAPSQTVNTSSLVTTSSFNAFTSSYNTGSFTGSFTGTSSFATNALTASYLSGYVSPFPYTGSAQITGSLGVTGSLTVENTTRQVVLRNPGPGASGQVGILAIDGTFTSKTVGTPVFTVNVLDSNETIKGGIVYTKASNSATNTSLNYNSSADTAIYISGSGNVGIRTTTPQHTLDVNGSTRISNGLTVTGSIIGFTATLGSADTAGNVTVYNTYGSPHLTLSRPNQDSIFNFYNGSSVSPNVIDSINQNYLDIKSTTQLRLSTVGQSRLNINQSGTVIVNPTGSLTGSVALQVSGSALITGSVVVTGSISATQGITGSLFGTASWATNAVTASYITSSNVFGPFGSNSILSASYAATASYSKNLQISGSINNVDYIDFNTGSTVTQPTPGRLNWNDTDGTLDIGLKGSNVTLQIGQEEVARVVNKTGGNLLEADYHVVRIRSVSEGGAQGGRLAVILAQADNDANSATTLGVVTETINVNQEGFITLSGQVKKINTTGTLQGETWVDGDVLYLSPTIPGHLTNIKPQAPQHAVIVGYVEYAHINQGKIFVKVDNGYEIDELHNVRINTGSLTSGQLLVRSGSVWVNSNQLTGSYGLTGSLQATSFSGSFSGSGANLNSIPASAITGLNLSQIATGSVTASVSPTQFTVSSASVAELTVTGNGVTLGSALTDTHNVTGSLNITGSITATTYNNLPTASVSSSGILSSSDWNIFNNKQNDLWTFQRTQGVFFFDDFLGTNDSSGIAASTGLAMGTTGAGTVNRITGVYPTRTNQQGVLLLGTGTTTGGTGNFRLGSTNAPTHYIGSGSISYEVYINIEQLSTLANRFVTTFGLYSNLGSGFSTVNGIFFVYDEGGIWAFGAIPASPSWRCITTNASTRTITNTGVDIVASAWVKLRFEINANATSVGFYINDILVATHTTNIPSTTTPMLYYNVISKSTGTTAVNMYADYLALRQQFTTPR